MFQSLFCSPNTWNSNTIRIEPIVHCQKLHTLKANGLRFKPVDTAMAFATAGMAGSTGTSLEDRLWIPTALLFLQTFQCRKHCRPSAFRTCSTPTLSSPYQILQRTIGLCLSVTMLRSCLGLHNFRFLFLSHLVQAQSHNLEVNGQILDEITSVACFWSDE